MLRDETVAAVLGALGHATGSDRAMAREAAALEAATGNLPPLIVVTSGAVIPHFVGQGVEVTDEGGTCRPLELADGEIVAALAPGYYTIAKGARSTRLAVAPRRCPQPPGGARLPFGLAVQIPALRGRRQGAYGTFAELAELAQAAGERGADAVAINPVHALFPGHGEGYSPYSPSSRLFLNGALGDPELVGLPPLVSPAGDALIDWRKALPERLDALRGCFAALDGERRAAIAADSAAHGDTLMRHALFDALDCHFRPRGSTGWQDWPARYRDPADAAARRFAREQAEEVEFHLFVQWLARESLKAAQQAARDAGMRIGLIGDLAVGVTPGGSDMWSLRAAMLGGLTIGAPPDPLGPHGQNWSITGFSPQGLKDSGYAPFIAMLRGQFEGCGALRIDHAFGLGRLWVIPEGGGAGDGAYLRFPFDDLLGLIALEAHRADAQVILENLGTSPFGFAETIRERGMLGMQVLWFERAEDHGFIGAHDYQPGSVALTGTHDTCTVAGWWSGRDLDWAAKLGRLPADVDRAKAEEIRDWDRGLLWSTLAEGERPAPDDPGPVVDAAIAHVATTPCALALVPVEDLLAMPEQPNLPGTITEHPNWVQRIERPTAEWIDDPAVVRRLGILRSLRPPGAD